MGNPWLPDDCVCTACPQHCTVNRYYSCCGSSIHSHSCPRKTYMGGLALIALLTFAVPFIALYFAMNWWDNLMLTSIPYGRVTAKSISGDQISDPTWSGRIILR